MTPQEIVERALAAARTGGCIAIVTESSAANLRWAGNTLTTNGVARSRRLTAIAIEHRRDGMATGTISRAGIRTDHEIIDVVRAAEEAARQGSAMQDGRPLIDAGSRQPSGNWDDDAGTTGIGTFSGLATALGDRFAAAQAAGRKLYGFAEHELSCTFLGTSSGLRLRHDQPSGRVELNAKSADMERSAYTSAVTRDFHDVDIAALDAELTRRLEWAKRTLALPPGRYETLLTPTAVADLLIGLYHSAGAKDAYEGRTVFSKRGGGTRVGERLATLPVSLRSDPNAPGLECAPFVLAYASSRATSVFDNGLPLRPTEWISGGVLAALVQTRYSAELTGLPVTPAINNLIFDLGAERSDSGLDEMIASSSRALLVNCLWYIREVDPQTLLVTGLTRDGVYLVENGEVTGAVNNFRFNESPVAMLDRLGQVGATRRCLPREWGDYFPRTAAPHVRVAGFNMSSVSKAS